MRLVQLWTLLAIILLVRIYFFKSVETETTVSTDYFFTSQSNVDSTLEVSLKRIGIDCPEWVLAQIILETGYLKSDIYKNGNNLFGMKVPYKRKGYSIGTYKGHAKFSKRAYSLIDYKEYQDTYWKKYKKRKKCSCNNYGDFLLQAGYAEDPDYIKKLQKLIR